MLHLFIYIFILLICLYILNNYKSLTKLDILILLITSIVLIIHTIYSRKYNEHFSSSIEDYSFIKNEEDISSIKDNLVAYLTIFNSDSYTGSGKVWYNIAPNKKPENTQYILSIEPSISDKSIYLGNNMIFGPLTSDLDIVFHGTFTIVLALKFDDLTVTDQNPEIELLKLYANCSTNNALTLYIDKSTLNTKNDVQTASLLFKYAEDQAVPCLPNNNSDFMNFDKDVLTYFFIVKDVSTITIYKMNENSSSVYSTLLTYNITNSSINFSNKEMVINRFSNLNAKIYNFAIYNTALPASLITRYHAHFNNEYLKNKDTSYVNISNKYNEILDAYKKSMSCPYDNTVNATCSTVINWNDMQQIVGSSSQCKESIAKYCSTNTTNTSCKCWDINSSIYKTDACRQYRNLFSTDSNAFDDLTNDNLLYIKKKYNLINPEDCPKPITAPDFITNQYKDYDWNKLKVYLDSNAIVSSSNSNVAISSNDFSVTNFFKEDPYLNDNTIVNDIIQPSKPLQTTISTPKQQKSDTFFNKFMKVIIPSGN